MFSISGQSSQDSKFDLAIKPEVNAISATTGVFARTSATNLNA